MAPPSSVTINLAEPVVFLRGQYAAGEDSDGRPRPDNLEGPPSQIRGLLTLDITKPCRIKKIELTLKGEVRTEWPEGIGPQRMNTSEEKVVLEETGILFNAARSRKRASSIGPGLHLDNHSLNGQATAVPPAPRTAGLPPSQYTSHGASLFPPRTDIAAATLQRPVMQRATSSVDVRPQASELGHHRTRSTAVSAASSPDTGSGPMSSPGGALSEDDRRGFAGAVSRRPFSFHLLDSHRLRLPSTGNGPAPQNSLSPSFPALPISEDNESDFEDPRGPAPMYTPDPEPDAGGNEDAVSDWETEATAKPSQPDRRPSNAETIRASANKFSFTGMLTKASKAAHGQTHGHSHSSGASPFVHVSSSSGDGSSHPVSHDYFSRAIRSSPASPAKSTTPAQDSRQRHVPLASAGLSSGSEAGSRATSPAAEFDSVRGRKPAAFKALIGMGSHGKEKDHSEHGSGKEEKGKGKERKKEKEKKEEKSKEKKEETGEKHGREFQKGVYTYPISFPVSASVPPTLHCNFGSITYTLRATVHRSGPLTPNLVAVREVNLVAQPGEDDTEEAENISVDKDWQEQLGYQVLLSGKSFPIGTRVPFSVKFVPMAKVKVWRILITLEERIDYYAANGKHERHQGPRKFVLLKLVNEGSTPLLPITSDSPTALADSVLAPYIPTLTPPDDNLPVSDPMMATNAAFAASAPMDRGVGSSTTTIQGAGTFSPLPAYVAGDPISEVARADEAGSSLLDPIGTWLLEGHLQLPSCGDEVHHSSNHTNSSINVSHLLRISLRVERGDDEHLDSKGKRKQWDITAESPVHLLSCRATPDYTLLPSYLSITDPIPENGFTTGQCCCPNSDPRYGGARTQAVATRVLNDYLSGVGPRPSLADMREAVGGGPRGRSSQSVESTPSPTTPVRGSAARDASVGARIATSSERGSSRSTPNAVSSFGGSALVPSSPSANSPPRSAPPGTGVIPLSELSRRYERLVSGVEDERGLQAEVPPPVYSER